MNRERTVVTAMFLLLLVLLMGFLIHRAPRFAGSAWGGALGVSAALLMLVPLAYVLVKRVSWLKEKAATRQWLPKLLVWHLYAGILGAFLAILHSGHRFQSWLGILLTTTMLLSVLSGYIGRHFLQFVAGELKEREATLVTLRAAYDERSNQITAIPSAAAAITQQTSVGGRLAAVIAPNSEAYSASNLARGALGLASAIADMEYSISADTAIKRRLRIWLSMHIATSIGFYVLLALHIGAGVQYGLRWFA